MHKIPETWSSKRWNYSGIVQEKSKNDWIIQAQSAVNERNLLLNERGMNIGEIGMKCSKRAENAYRTKEMSLEEWNLLLEELIK